MKYQSLYYSLWRKYAPAITLQMKNATNGGPREVKMVRNEFEALGKRKVSDYLFNLEIGNGKVSNNINGTEVARDLFDILNQNEASHALLANQYYKFSLGKEFILTISIIPTA